MFNYLTIFSDLMLIHLFAINTPKLIFVILLVHTPAHGIIFNSIDILRYVI